MTTPTTPAADAVSLHDLIMNIPTCRLVEAMGDADRFSYKSGHRDARHAAAELATARESALVAERDALRAEVAVMNRLLPILSDCLKHQQVNSASEIMRQIEQELAALAAPAVEG